MKRGQISVPLDPKQREFIEQQAEREDRSVANVIRRLVEAARAQAAPSERAAG